MSKYATLTVAEVASATGYSRVAVHRAIRDQRMGRWLIRDQRGRARLIAEVVDAIRRGAVLRVRADTRRPAAPPPPPPPPAGDGDGDGLSATVWAPWANELLDADQWSPPPWDPTQWASLAVVLDQAADLATEHGPLTADALTRWEAALGNE